MAENLETYFNSEKSKDHALKLLEYLNNEYRTAERYLYIGLAFLFGLLAYLWKEVDVVTGTDSFFIIYTTFLIIWGVNLGIGLVYLWYLGVAISILDYEHKLQWLHIRPMVQFNLGVLNGKTDKNTILLLSPILIPIISGIISGLFYFFKIVVPVIFLKCKDIDFLLSIGIIFTVLICFTGLILTLKTTFDFQKAILKNFPPRNFEMGRGEE